MAPKSMDAVLDEERREVLKLLEDQAARQSKNRNSGGSMGSAMRAASPYNSPRSPVRSMLDIDPPRPGSITGTTTGVTVPIRSMLDITTAPPPATTQSAQTSPTATKHTPLLSNNTTTRQGRSSSDVGYAPRSPLSPLSHQAPSNDPIAGYQFGGILASNPGGPVQPKRNTQGGRKSIGGTNAMAEVARATDLGGYGRDSRGRNSMPGQGSSHHQSKSPHNRLGFRSNSPHTGNFNLNPGPGKFALDNGQIVDMSSAYRRLSDANLALSGGSLSGLSSKGKRRTDSAGEPESSRLEKDYSYQDGENAVVDSSDEDNYSSDEGHRGRRKANDDGDRDPESTTIGMGQAKGPRKTLSLMAAAEEERQKVDAKYRVRSLLDPEITITDPMGQRMKNSRARVHPTTSFDQGGSGANTPMTSDTEADITDIKRAQKLSVNLTPITSTPETNRCVRTIYRGDFGKMQQEAEDDQRRVRRYLVATDLSDEAAHALEWTIGTVLRDGDTLLAIYCVDEETGLGLDGMHDEPSLQVQAAQIAAQTNTSATRSTMAFTIPATSSPGPSRLGIGQGGTASRSASPMAKEKGKAESERFHAVEDITARVSKLLRKTKLQVRVIVEVIHCKSPKHLITEVIDFINPTLVILGSRGRSALKGYVSLNSHSSLISRYVKRTLCRCIGNIWGSKTSGTESILTDSSVILGSFSNYLVTKSSVPVMVARKKLKKHSKYKRPVKLANNLTNVSNKSLASAIID